MDWKLGKKVAIAGIGQTTFFRPGKSERTGLDLACEAAVAACEDAGLSPHEIDGIATYFVEQTCPYTVAQSLGVKQLQFTDRVPLGGESLAATIHHAAMAIASGACRAVLCYRSLSARLIKTKAKEEIAIAEEASGNTAFRYDFLHPFGAFIPAQLYALQFRRHMIEYGTTSRQLGMVALSQNANAQRNPRAIHHGRPITLETHQSSVMISDPYRLYDCSQEAEGSCAVLVVSSEQARDLRQKPARLLAAAEGSGRADQLSNQVRHYGRWSSGGMREIAETLYARAGVSARDIDVAQIFDTFSGQVILGLEDFQFCAPGEGGAFVESGAIRSGTGNIPINTAGGGLAEGYIHGFNNLLEGVRQIRGTSVNQVAGAELSLVTSAASAMPSSALILCP